MKPTTKMTGLLLAILLLFNAEGIAPPPVVSAQEAPLVLAFYYAWFDQNTWSSDQVADSPVEPYNSADRATIERHVFQAQSAGIDALVQSWYGPQEVNNQTETNFRILLDVATAKGFKAAVDVETTGPFFGDAGAVTGALTTLLATHAQHPAYLRYQDKPVIFFWQQQRFSVEEWAAIRNQVDPEHSTYWIAEGVDIAYQAVFDGHHLYNIAWAASPADQMAKWSDRVRAYAAENQVNRLWVATAMPGYDDTRLPRDDTSVVSRRNGDYYRETWRGALASQPNMIIVTSFNEWLEGTQIEPSITYGNLYLDTTRELVTALRGRPPAAPAAVEVAAQELPSEESQAQETPPDGPYIKIEDLTNVRNGPATTFTRLGTLAAGSTVPVTGRPESGGWWQIDFEGGQEGKGWVSAEVVEFVGEPSEVPLVETPSLETTTETATDTPAEESLEPSTQPATQAEGDVPLVKIPAGGVNVRSGPDLNFDLLGRLDENSSARVVAKNETGDWWQIEYRAGENGLAWVADVVVDFFGDSNTVPIATNITGEAEPVPAETPTPAPVEPIIAGSIEAIDPVNVRAEPSLEGLLVGGLYPGEIADVFAISQDGDWWQIDFPDAPDETGWVAAEFVRFQGDKAGVPIFGLGTPTPTPGPTDTPTPTPLPPSPTPIQWPATYAPTATSVYQATSVAFLANRGTPDPTVTKLNSEQQSSFQWSSIPWGIFSILIVLAFFWYQFSRRWRGRSRRSGPKP